MQADVAGISIDVGAIVWVFDIWASRPVYHRADFKGPIGAMYLVTACGVPCDAERRREGSSAIALPPKHATRLGRPCATCWPELRANVSLFTRRAGPGTTRPVQEAIENGDD